MNRILIILVASLFFTPVLGQEEIDVANSGKEIVLSFVNSGVKTTVSLSEINPFRDTHKRYKDTTLTTSKMYIVEGQVSLKSLVGAVYRDKYEPLPTEVSEIVTKIQVYNPNVYLSDNKRFAAVVFNEIYYNNYNLIYAKSIVIMYNSEGKIYGQFEFETSIKSAQLSGDGRYLLFSFEEGSEYKLVNAGFSIYDSKLEKIICSKRLPENSYNPFCSSNNNILIVGSKLPKSSALYYVFIPQTENLFSLLINDKSKYSELKISNDGFYFNHKNECNKVDTFLFKRDFEQFIQD